MRYLLLLFLLCSACSKDSPVSPTPTPTPPAAITLTGHLTATGSGQPLQGVSVDLGGLTATTNAEGGFQVQTQPGAAQRLSLTGAGIIPRSLMVAIGGSREVNVDAMTSDVDLGFYRAFVRNGFEQPGNLQPLRRWTEAPRIYLRTIDEAGAAVDARTLDATTRAIVETATLFTGGRFGIAGLERGSETRAGVEGWLTVRFAPALSSCGFSTVGLSGGTIDLNHKIGGNCRCAGVSEIRPRTVRHELGHAFGFWHTDSPTDLMSGQSVLGCDALPSARERAAAAIAYSRPVGNVDPDIDPASVVTLQPLRVP